MDAPWRSILVPRLGEPVAAKVFDWFPKSPDLVFAVQKSVSENPAWTGEQIGQLLLILDCYEICRVSNNLSDNDSLLALVLSNTTDVRTLDDVAKKSYALANASTTPSLTQTLLGEYRKRLLKRRPTAVLSGLVDSNTIKASKTTVHEEVKALLSKAVQVGFDISKANILTFCGDHARESTPEARQFVTSLQKLHWVVNDARDIQKILAADFKSARDIAAASNPFESLKTSGLDEYTAALIVSQATKIEQRNSQIWNDYMRLRTRIPLLAVDDVTSSSSGATKVAASIATMFEDLDTVQIDQDMSVLGPAAYLVDLFELIRLAARTSRGIEVRTNQSPLETEFFKRRPDLRKLELSKANTKNLVRYVDLVNETLESYIITNDLKPRIATLYNEPPDTLRASQGGVSVENTSWDVYQKSLSTALVPMNQFPFNLATETMRALLQAQGIARIEILRLISNADEFAMRNFVSLSVNTSGPSRDQEVVNRRSLVKECWDRWSAADTLGLCHDDFIVITGQAFQSLNFVRIMADARPGCITPTDYYNRIGQRTLGEYWGMPELTPMWVDGQNTYEVKADPIRVTSLSVTSILSAAGIEFKDLVAVLQTAYMANQLVIEVVKRSADGKNRYSDKVQDMQLKCPTDFSADQPRVAFTNAMSKLQAFVRLWQRTKWKISDLDAAIMTISENNTASNGSSQQHTIIPPEVVVDLSAVSTLASRSGIDIQRLLPLWANIRTDSDISLYMKLFGAFIKRYPGLQEKKEVSSTLDTISAPMIAVLGISQFEWKSILTIACLKENDQCDISNISRLYRAAYICKILAIGPDQYSSWVEIFPASQFVFASPKVTLDIYEQWMSLCNGSTWTSDSLLDFSNTLSQSVSGATDLQELVSQMKKLVKESQTKITTVKNTISSDMEDDAAYSTERLLDVCTQAFSPDTAKKLVELVQDNLILSVPFATADPGKIAKKEPTRAQVTATTLIFRGLLLDQDLSNLKGWSNETAFQQAVTDLYNISEELKRLLKATLGEPLASNLYQSSMIGEVQVAVTPPAVARGKEVLKVLTEVVERARAKADLTAALLAMFPVLQEETVAAWVLRLRVKNDVGNPAEIQSLLDAQTLNPSIIERILRIFQTTSKVLAIYKLNGDDLNLLSKQGISIEDCRWDTLESLQRYSRLRDIMARSSGISPTTMYSKIAQIQKSQVSNFDKVCSLIASSTNWPPQIFQQALKAQGLDGTTSDHTDQITRITTLVKTNDIIECSQKIGVTIDTLEKLCRVYLPEQRDKEFEVAKDLQNLLNVNAASTARPVIENLALRRRDALNAWLVKRIPGKGDLDALTEYFLIDVSMGPQQKTSRIRQAISTAQLFINRCLLGLEKDSGIESTMISQDKWAWMQRFTLWQANRKVFLYPENWVEPSLRDNKSDPFKAVETMMMESDLSMPRINELMRQYVYHANEIADLEIQAYLCEGNSPDMTYFSRYHFFARTRTIPYHYFYRTMSLTGINAGNSSTQWSPWTGLEVEIAAVEADWDGKALSPPGSYLVPALYRGRLLLFLPQLTVLKASAATSSAPTSTETLNAYLGAKLAKDTIPTRSWEIKMGWCELLNGKWSKKQVSNTRITLSDPLGVLPSAASFSFAVKHRQVTSSSPNTKLAEFEDILVIEVYVSSTNSKLMEASSTAGMSAYLAYLGQFELKGTQVVLGGLDSSAPFSKSIDKGVPTTGGFWAYATSFQKLQMMTKSTAMKDIQKELRGTSSSNSGSPFLASCPTNATAVELAALKYTISLNHIQHKMPIGLVLERVTTSQVESYFGIPSLTKEGTIRDKGEDHTDSVQSLMHDASQPLVEQATSSSDLDSLYAVLEQVPPNLQKNAFGYRGGGLWHELGAPCSIYNWELGFHLVHLLVERLYTTQQFELALDIARLVFDLRDRPIKAKKNLFVALPSRATADTIDADAQLFGEVDTGPDDLKRCWRFLPFKSTILRKAESVRGLINNLKPFQSSSQIEQWQANPFNVHAVARTRPGVYMKRFIIKYTEVLMAIGDELFRQDSMDTISTALQYYIEASRLFGRAPQINPSQTKASSPKTYNDLLQNMNAFAGAQVDLELEFPFYVEEGPVIAQPAGVLGMVPTSYFPVPANPQLSALREMIDDRLFKIRNSLDINGRYRELALFDPPIDPGQLIRSWSSRTGGLIASFSSFVDGPMPNYRFVYLLQKAFELCAELRAQSDAYLVIREKRDAEKLAGLRSKQDLVMQTMTMSIKTKQREDAVKTIEILQKTREQHAVRLQYYLDLTGNRTHKVPDPQSAWIDIPQDVRPVTDDELAMNDQEQIEMQKLDEAAVYNTAANALETVASVYLALPNLIENGEPFGCGVTMKFDGGNIAQGYMVGANIMKTLSQARTEQAGRASRKGRLIQQLQERRLQANMAAHDIKGVDQQIESQQLKVELCDLEIQRQTQQVADATAIDEYMRTKYTNESLYAWYEGGLRQSLYSTYLLAMDAAKAAEKAFDFERGKPARNTAGKTPLANSYWDNSRDGALSAQNLYLGLKRLESAYQKGYTHDYELTKQISLRSIDALALINLQETGQTFFSLPEIMFDFDFPGHYCRRIKSVSITIPCIIGPYTSPCCTLQLQEHRYRLKQNLQGTPYYPEAIQADERYHSDKIPITSAAISSAQNDSGQFQVNFNGERYGPFEGAGAISRWSLRLPDIRQFDYRTISDVIIRLDYTALDGGEVWRTAATKSVKQKVSEAAGASSIVLIDLSRSVTVQSTDTSTPKSVSFKCNDLTAELPFWARSSNMKATFTQAQVFGLDGQTLKDTKINQQALEKSKTMIEGIAIYGCGFSGYTRADIEVSVPNKAASDIRGKDSRFWLALSFTVSDSGKK